MNPEEKLPKMPPNALIDPIHESCSLVSGPVINGDSFDNSTGVAGETHPIGHGIIDLMYFFAMILTEL